MSKLNYKTALEIIGHEAVVRQAYKDSKGIWTWSIGITSASGHNVERYIGKPQTMEYCLAVYVWLLERYLKDVEAAFTKPLEEHQRAAALSFHWNTGAIKRASWVKEFNKGNIAKAKVAFMQWKKPPEIEERRKKERDLFFDGKWSATGKVTEYTRITSKGSPDWTSGKKVDITKELTKALSASPSSITGLVDIPPVVNIYDGNVHEEVKKVQTLLRDKKFFGVGKVDGRYGNFTAAAIMAFRRENGLEINDRIDDELLLGLTKAEVREVSAARASATEEDLKDSKVIQKVTAAKNSIETMFFGGVAWAGSKIFGGDVVEGLSTAHTIYNFVTENWILAVVLLVGAFGWWKSKQGVNAEVKAFQEGRHV